MGLLSSAVALAILVWAAVVASPTSFYDIHRRQSWVIPPTRYCEPGLNNVCYASVTNTDSITLRVMVPDTPPPYDILFQVMAPTSVGWAGIAWGGQMVGNPLTVCWANGNSAIISSHWATQWKSPAAYGGASYTTFSKSSNNGSYWRAVGLCKGCSQFTYSNGTQHTLTTSGQNQIGWAMCPTRPSNPASNMSSFTQHTDQDYFIFDFTTARVSASAFQSAITALGH